MLPSEQRVYGSEQLGLLWGDATGPISETVEVDFALSTMSAGSELDGQLAGLDIDVLRAAPADVKQRLRGLRRCLRGDRLVPRRQSGDEAGHQTGHRIHRPDAAESRPPKCAKRSMARRRSESSGAGTTYAPWSAIRAMSAARSATSRTFAFPPRTAARCPSPRSRLSSPGAGSRRSGAWTATGRSTSRPRSIQGVTSADAVIRPERAYFRRYRPGTRVFYTFEGPSCSIEAVEPPTASAAFVLAPFCPPPDSDRFRGILLGAANLVDAHDQGLRLRRRPPAR